MVLALLALVGVGMILLHMIRPRFERRVVSSARFFADLPQARKGQPRLRLASPVASRPLYLQLPLMALLLVAVWSASRDDEGREALGFGVWVAIDTSASMMTRGESGTRMELALEEARRVLGEARSAAGNNAACFRIGTFDQELVTLAEGDDPASVSTRIEARALGTDLNLIRGLRARLANNRETDCPITHLVVISDMPVPDWVGEESEVAVLWRPVGEPVQNTGFSSIEGIRDPLTGSIDRVSVTLTSYGPAPGDRRFRLLGPDGSVLTETSPTWSPDGAWRFDFEPGESGRYGLELVGEDAYPLDDVATIRLNTGSGLRVDWRLPDRTLPDLLGWRQEAERPVLRVARLPVIEDRVPTLYLGAGLEGGAAGELRDFFEPSDLLRNINLDVLETLPIAGTDLPEGFRPVARRLDGSVILAERDEPPAVVVPGLPRTGDENLNRFATTVFFNGMRALTGDLPPSPLYELTSPADPEPSETRVALHPGEGNTARMARPHGNLDSLEPVAIQLEEASRWPLLLMIAAALLAVERLLGAFGGPRWR